MGICIWMMCVWVVSERSVVFTRRGEREGKLVNRKFVYSVICRQFNLLSF